MRKGIVGNYRSVFQVTVTYPNEVRKKAILANYHFSRMYSHVIGGAEQAFFYINS